MERRNFIKFLLASPVVPSIVKEKIEDGDEPRFTRVELVYEDSGTYPNRVGDRLWVYIIPKGHYGIGKNGRYYSKTSFKVVK